MKVRVSLPGKESKKLKEKLLVPVMAIENEAHEINLVVVS